MPTTAPTHPPTTPAEVAAAALDAIEAHPDAFEMSLWASLADVGALPPSVAPACGTTLCAAGWVAHVVGWTIVVLDDEDPVEDILIVEEDGTESLTMGSVFAEKDGERHLISEVARAALGLTQAQTFWYSDEPTALKRLGEIAAR